MINILNKKKCIIVGLNSGTSVDGLDMVAIEIDRSRNSYKMRYLYGNEKKFPKALKDEILNIADNVNPAIDDIIYMNNILGKFFSKAVGSFLKKLQKKNIVVDAIASHGQTIRHLPKKVNRLGSLVNGTMQIGSADYIAQLTHLPVISDFRQADIVSGGEGAPITTDAMFKMYATSKDSMLMLNIGGMSNYYYLPKILSNEKRLAQDCGPGNVLSDLIMRKLYNKEFDKNGVIAKSGTISKRLLTILLSDSFLQEKEKSTGRERFGAIKVDLLIKQAREFKLSNGDILATSIEFSVFSIFESLKKLIKNKKIEKLYLTGGGRKNIFLVERLQSYLPHCQIERIDTLGIDGDFVEAVAFAVMGEATLYGESLQQLKSNKSRLIFGKITLAPERV